MSASGALLDSIPRASGTAPGSAYPYYTPSGTVYAGVNQCAGYVGCRSRQATGYSLPYGNGPTDSGGKYPNGKEFTKNGSSGKAGNAIVCEYDHGADSESGLYAAAGHVMFIERVYSDGALLTSCTVFGAQKYWAAGSVYVGRVFECTTVYGTTYFKITGFTDNPNGDGGTDPDPSPGPGPDPPATYTATGTVISPVEGCYVKFAINQAGSEPADSEYTDTVTGEENTSGKFVYCKVFNEAGNDEDGYPKAEFLGGNGSTTYRDNPRYFWGEDQNSLPNADVSVTATFVSYPGRYYSDSGSQGPGYVEAGFSTSSTSQDFKGRPYYHQNDTIYEVPKPSTGCIFKGGDVNGNDRSAYKTVPGSTDNDISAMAYFASLTNPYTWRFGDDTYSDKTKYITACSCTFSGKVLGGTTVGPKIGLYISTDLVAQGYGTINGTGYAVTTSNTVKVKALEDSGSNYFMDVSLTSFKLTYYIYEKDNTGQGETRYLYTDYFDGSKGTYGKRAEV